jgi:hypothetical protein
MRKIIKKNALPPIPPINANLTGKLVGIHIYQAVFQLTSLLRLTLANPLF